MKIQQVQKQKQIISQNMIQSVEILQMSSLDLSKYIKEMALENPVVEVLERSAEDVQVELLKKQEWLAGLDEQNRAYHSYDQEDKEYDRMDNIGLEISESIADFLHLQLLDGSYSDFEMEIFDFIAHCLDNRGYFTEPVSAIGRQFGISEEKASQYLSIMKDLEPVGVCASSLEECLTKQLEKMDGDYNREITMVNKYLELLGKNQLHVIAKKMKCSIDEIKEASENIKQLNPKPGRGFGNSEMLRFIEPDITIIKFQDHFEILLNNYSYPAFRVSNDYLTMLKSDCDKEVKEYLNNKVKQAEKVQECVTRRSNTLMALAKCILEVQEEFFLGTGKTLKPLRFLDAAEKIGVHESTISRAVKDKYLQCCWGVYPLSFFFSRGIVSTVDEEEVAASNVKQELQHIIDQEDKKKPYSDQKLADLLAEKGISISRRTVTKYREAMGIANGRERKEF